VVPRLRRFVPEPRFFLPLGSLALLAAMFFFSSRRYVVEGGSMLPALKPGDGVVVNRLSYRLRKPKVGDIAVVRPPDGSDRLDVKRIVAGPGDQVEVRGQAAVLGPDEWFVQGDNATESTDSRQMGPLRRSDLIGPVWFTY
jgi:signal peptidase I